MSYRSQARRSADVVTVANLTGSFSTADQILMGSAAIDLDSYVLDGFSLERTGGAEASLKVTVRYYDQESGGNCVYEDTVTVDANDDTAGALGLGLPMNRSAATGIWYRMKASAGSDTDVTLITYLAPLVV